MDDLLRQIQTCKVEAYGVKCELLLFYWHLYARTGSSPTRLGVGVGMSPNALSGFSQGVVLEA